MSVVEIVRYRVPVEFSSGLTAGFSPADATTYEFGSFSEMSNPATGGAQALPTLAPVTGRVVEVYGYARVGGTIGSAEQSTVSLMVNGSATDTITTTLQLDAAGRLNKFSVTGLSRAVTANDNLDIRWLTPTWTTNPTAVWMRVWAVIEVP